jgi:hypothetical protein
LLIEPADGRFRDGSIRVVDKRESTGTAGFTIDWKNDLGGFSNA